jgi:protein-disulfide isomerase
MKLVGFCALLAALPAAAAPPAGETVRIEHVDPLAAPVKGPANALVTIEVFFAPSYNAANRFPGLRLIEALQERHAARARIIYRMVKRSAQPPGPQVPTLALEAYTEGHFFDFLALYGQQRTAQTRDQLIDIARRAGVDPVRAERAIAEDRYGPVLDDNDRRIERLHGQTAPIVFFNSRQLRGTLSALKEEDLEAAYRDALDRARDALDRGFSRKQLMSVFDSQAAQDVRDVVVATSAGEDSLDREVVDHPLADPALDVSGMPALGAASKEALPVIILCRPNDERCSDQLRVAPRLTRRFRGEVRVVWAPWFDVLARDDAADLAMLGDAALCAERVGSSPDDIDASPGWLWVTEMYAQLSTTRGRRLPPEKLIATIAARLNIDASALSACRASTANATLDWVTAARRSGVTGSPAIVIGGRIYAGLSNNDDIITALVEMELAPGVLGRLTDG